MTPDTILCDHLHSVHTHCIRNRWLLIVIPTFFCGLCFRETGTARAQELNDRHREYNVKAVFLYSFIRYVHWPDESFVGTDGNFVIGVLGEDPFQGALDAVAEKRQVDNRHIVIRRFRDLGSIEYCHILFVPRETSLDEQKSTLSALAGRGILVVGETSGFAEAGGAIGFYNVESRVKFEINTGIARREGLTLDAKLLRLGKRVD